MTARTPVLVMLAAVAIGGHVDAQSTIPELARKRPANPIVRGRIGDVSPMTLQALTLGAELIVDATVTRQRSYLTSNEQHILTDYQVVPIRVLAGTIPVTRASPGSSPLILTVYGGEMTIEGFTAYVVDHAVKPPESGRRYLLFMRPFGTDGHYQLYKAGAFEVRDQELRSLLTRDGQLLKEITDIQFDEAVSRIADAAKARKDAQIVR